jgi:hypothetical protein
MVRECFVFLELKRRRVEGPPARSQLCVLSTLSSRVTSPVPTSCTVVFNLAGFRPVQRVRDFTAPMMLTRATRFISQKG